MSLLMRCKSAPEIVRRSDIDIAVAELKKINVPQVAMGLPALLTELRETPFALSISGWPATRSPTGRRVAEPEGFERQTNALDFASQISTYRNVRFGTHVLAD